MTAVVYRYEAALGIPVDLEEGWISIVGINDPDCRFYWYRSDQGNGVHHRVTPDINMPATGDLSFCLLPEGVLAIEGEGEGEPAVPGDFNDDGMVNLEDLLILLDGWGSEYGLQELLDLLDNWGYTSPAPAPSLLQRIRDVLPWWSGPAFPALP